MNKVLKFLSGLLIVAGVLLLIGSVGAFENDGITWCQFTKQMFISLGLLFTGSIRYIF